MKKYTAAFIGVSQSDIERGKVTGTPVGCACGEGRDRLETYFELCRRALRDIVLTVNGTVVQAERSL